MSWGVDEEKRNVDTHEAVRDWESEVMSESAKSQHELEAGIYKVKVKTEWDELMLSVSRNNKKAEEEAAAKKAEEEAAAKKAEEEAAAKKAEEEAAAKKAEEEAAKKVEEEARKQAEAAAITTTAVTTATETQPAASQATETQPAASQATETQPAASQATETQPAASQAAETEAPLPETNEWKYDEMLSLMQWLSAELQSVQTGPVVLTWKQMKDLHRITLLRAPFFWASITNRDAEEAGREDIITSEDLRNKKSMRKARRRLKKLTKQEKSYKKDLDKLIDAQAEYVNAKNATNRSLHISSALWLLNERLENWEYIDRTYALLPNVSPLVLNLCNKKNQKALEAWNHIQVMNNWKSVDVYTESAIASAWRAWWYLASWWAWYSNVFEKFLVENTKMSQSQAKSMINTWIIAWALIAWYFLFTKKEWDSRKFSFPSLWTLAALTLVPLWLNYASQMTTWNSLLDNLSRLWTKWELPWSSSDSQEVHEQGASQQVMWQFVLLWIPKSKIKEFWTFTNSKLTKINLWRLSKYLWELENNTIYSSDERSRFWMQRIAIQKIMNDNWASIALNNYIAGLWISDSDLNGVGTIDDRLSESRAKYQKMLDYISERGLLIDKSKNEKVMDALTKEKDVDDDLFDKLKEEWCFIPNPEDSRYKEISKLNVSNEKKIKIYEAYKKLCDEWTEYGNIKLEVVNNKIQITSWSKSSTEEHKILLNPDNKIDNLVNVWGVNIEFKTEEELIRMWLFVNYLRSTWWKESTKAEYQKGPFVLGSSAKLWEDIQFMKPTGPETVLSSAVPFFSDMARKFPTIEEGKKREFLVKYLNNLWEKEHTAS